ncbi:MAG: hypothetical protein ACOH5I_00340 [Oligoflexus sp.]
MSESIVNLEIEGITSHVFPFQCLMRVQNASVLLKDAAETTIELKQLPSILGDKTDSQIMAVTPPFLRGEMTELKPLSFDFRREVSDRFHPKNYNNGTLILECYRMILRDIYQVDTRFYSVDRDSSIIVHDRDGYHLYSYEMDHRFVKVKLLNQDLRLLDQHKLNELRRASNVNQLLALLPPENFEFTGFGVWRRQKFDLFRNFSVLSREIRHNETMVIEVILQWIKENGGLKNAEVGVSIKHDQFMRRYSTPQIQKGSLLSAAQSFNYADIINQETRSTFLDDNFATFSKGEMIGTYSWLDAFNERKLDHITILPLWHQDMMVGLIDLASNDDILVDKRIRSQVLELKSFLELLITNQITKEMGEIESTIRKQCTAIHPVVEWKFHEVAKHYNRSKTKGLRMPPIVFRDIYPLYGVTLIEESVQLRRNSIQEDFKSQLESLKEIFQTALHLSRIPFIEHLLFEVNEMLQQVQQSIEPGDEAVIIAQLREKIHPALELVGRQSEELDKMVRSYLKKIHNETGGSNSFREEFNQSVHQINESIMLYLHQEQAGAQRVVPHYFEKHTSYGVRHTMYVGKSLLKDRTLFHFSQLANLRLWQMLIMCGSARRTAMLQSRLPVPLQTAHLILAQDHPVAITFDYDEKSMVLQGHESIRYDVLKKRISKAVIKGSDLPLAVPDTLSIIFTNDRERQEYLNYINFLQWKGYLTQNVEEFLLVDLKGLHGLRAIRVGINTTKPEYSNLDVTQVQLGVDGVEWL